MANEEFGMYFIEDGETDIRASYIGLVVGVFVDGNLYVFQSRPDTWVIAFDLFLLAGGGYSVIIWCSYKMITHLRENMQHATPNIREMNSQINKTLFAQVRYFQVTLYQGVLDFLEFSKFYDFLNQKFFRLSDPYV